MRLYLGEITGLVLVLLTTFVAAGVASRFFPNRPPRLRMIRTIRNLFIAVIVAVFAASLTYSITVNQTPRGQIDRTAADQDQKSFEQRHSK